MIMHQRTDESTLGKGSSVHLIFRGPSYLRSLILIRVIPKERTRGACYGVYATRLAK